MTATQKSSVQSDNQSNLWNIKTEAPFRVETPCSAGLVLPLAGRRLDRPLLSALSHFSSSVTPLWSNRGTSRLGISTVLCGCLRCPLTLGLWRPTHRAALSLLRAAVGVSQTPPSTDFSSVVPLAWEVSVSPSAVLFTALPSVPGFLAGWFLPVGVLVLSGCLGVLFYWDHRSAPSVGKDIQSSNGNG